MQGIAKGKPLNIASSPSTAPRWRLLIDHFEPLWRARGRRADALLNLAFTIARQVVRREVSLQRDALLPVRVKRVDESSISMRIESFVNPQDLALLRADLEADGLSKVAASSPMHRIARSGCRFETARARSMQPCDALSAYWPRWVQRMAHAP